jgi:hypothetical protein
VRSFRPRVASFACRVRRSHMLCHRWVVRATARRSIRPEQLHKLTVGRRSALDRYGERKTIARGDSEDLCAFGMTRGGRRFHLGSVIGIWAPTTMWREPTLLRLVEPTAKPLFWRSRTLRLQTPPLVSAFLVRANAAPANPAPRPTCRSLSC